jgi:hypothetical protein
MLECVQLDVHFSYGLSSTRPYRGLDELKVITAGSVALMMPVLVQLTDAAGVYRLAVTDAGHLPRLVVHDMLSELVGMRRDGICEENR